MIDKKVKDLFYELARIFPNGMSSKEVEEVIIRESLRDALMKHNFLFGERTNGKIYYGLGGNGAILISIWENQRILEQSSKEAYKFNIILIFLTTILVILTVVMLWKLFNQ